MVKRFVFLVFCVKIYVEKVCFELTILSLNILLLLVYFVDGHVLHALQKVKKPNHKNTTHTILKVQVEIMFPKTHQNSQKNDVY